MLEALVLGSGAYEGVPHIAPLTAEGERTASATAFLTSPRNSKDKRRASSLVVRLHGLGKAHTVLVDAPGSFIESALDLFPKHGLRNIDAVLLTHAHDKAAGGLGHLRNWTSQSLVQDTVDVYCTKAVEAELREFHPWLFSSEKATGSRVVGPLTFHPIEAGVSFNLFGNTILPVEVEHGTRPDGLPNHVLGFLFAHDLLYLPSLNGISSASVNAIQSQLEHGLPLLLTSALRLQPHPSHFSFTQACYLAARLNARRTYLVRFADGPSHAQWETLCSTLRQASPPTLNDLAEATQWAEYQAPEGSDKESLLWNSAHTLSGIADEDDEGFIRFAMAEKGVSSARAKDVRPAFDGLAFRLGDDGKAYEVEKLL